MTANQPNYAGSTDNFAKDTPLQLTLRVMQAIFSNPRFWVGMAAVIVVLATMGPFNTLTDMSFASRLVYWGGISLATFPVAMAASIYLSVVLSDFGVPVAASRLLGGAVAGVPIAAIVYLANVYFAQTMSASLVNALRMVTYTVPISAAISVIYYLVESSMRQNGSASGSAKPATSSSSLESQAKSMSEPAFLSRLPKELGKDIISLQAQDHYVKVTTIMGSEMILVRLADAERELAGMEGSRVHRSWWLARKHISQLKRENDKLLAVLSNGTEVPVSRSYAKQVRSWFDG